MTEITVPIWLFALSAGVPCISFFSLLLFVLRKVRKPHKEMFVQMTSATQEAPAPQSRQFHKDLLSLQIDAVFNGLNAIIETERIKINTLLNQSANMGMDVAPPRNEENLSRCFQTPKRPAPQHPSLEEQIDKIAASDGQTETIADEMGLSQAEVELALKMRSARESVQHQRLEAVA